LKDILKLFAMSCESIQCLDVNNPDHKKSPKGWNKERASAATVGFEIKVAVAGKRYISYADYATMNIHGGQQC
jgi:tRNA threonylcarbamoyladenosine modification (KEOPS) complex Cgi121 subunit